MLNIIRYSKRPAKQFIWLTFQKHLRKSHGFEKCLDIACGDMFFYDFFKTKTYTGVDIDEKRLMDAKSAHPGANAISSSIENLPSDLKGDFVVCMQAIGINNLFNVENTVLVVNKLVDATAQGGTLIFNIGTECMKYRKEIEALLDKTFGKVKKINYGNFNDEKGMKTSLLLAFLMSAIPFIRGNTSVYYLCENKK